MFEAAIQPATLDSGAILRPLDWGELVARLSAARDMRALLTRPTSDASSFGARALAGLPHDSLGGDQGEPGVNLDALGPMKPLATIQATTVHNVADGDQGTQ